MTCNQDFGYHKNYKSVKVWWTSDNPILLSMFHCQIYISTTVNEAALAVQRFTACDKAVSDWMSASRLKLNPTKTEVLWLGSNQQLSQISITDIPLLSTTIRVGESARDLGVVIDS